MLKLGQDIVIHVALQPVDMRRSINGLAVAVVDELNQQPQAQHVFVFRNKKRDKVKILLWDHNGYVVHYKRLERGRFHWPQPSEDETELALTRDELQWLLAGLDWQALRGFPDLQKRALQF